MKILLILVLLSLTECTIRVSLPHELEGEYVEANLDLYPRVFNVSAHIAIANPFDGCENLKSDYIKGKIVVVSEAGRCYPQEKTKRILDSGGVGAILIGARGSIGIRYNWAPNGDKSILLPAIGTTIESFGKVIKYIAANPTKNVTVTIQNTTSNPWLELARSPLGVLFQLYFEIIAFATFLIASYKLTIFCMRSGIHFHITHTSLTLEICASVLKILMMTRPLSFYKFGWGPLTDSLFVGFIAYLSFTTDLLTTFYWQEILKQCQQPTLGNNVLNHLKKFRIPFVLVCLVVWSAGLFSDLSRANIIRTFPNSLQLSALVNLSVGFLITVFYLYTGSKLIWQLRQISLQNKQKLRQVSKLTLFIIATGILLFFQILASCLNLSPFTNLDPKAKLFVYFLFWTGVYGSSLAKVFMFELPKKKISVEKKSVEISTSRATSTSFASTFEVSVVEDNDGTDSV